MWMTNEQIRQDTEYIYVHTLWVNYQSFSIYFTLLTREVNSQSVWYGQVTADESLIITTVIHVGPLYLWEAP